MERSEPGIVQEIAPGVRGLIAPNPGPMTHWGTNTFLVGSRQVAVIDPGPGDDAHLSAIMGAVGDGELTHILVTHAHLDHSPLARTLSARTGAKILAYGAPDAGRTPIMQRLAAAGLSGGGEGVDARFEADQILRDGDRVTGEDWALDVLHTPGHFAGHLAFRLGDRVFSGDHVMDWSSSLVSPPDGSLTDFMTTSRRLEALRGVTFHPSHGGPISDPADRLRWLISHREGRETAILNALGRRDVTIPEVTAMVYAGINPALRPAAARNVFAHLVDLVERKLVVATPELAQDAGFRLA